jgi:hypothetical protein
VHTNAPPIFWEGKGNGKHEMEKFLKRKFNDFINAVYPKKNPIALAMGFT